MDVAGIQKAETEFREVIWRNASEVQEALSEAIVQFLPYSYVARCCLGFMLAWFSYGMFHFGETQTLLACTFFALLSFVGFRLECMRWERKTV